MGLAETILDDQFTSGIPWDEINVKIECVELTQDEIDELEEE